MDGCGSILLDVQEVQVNCLICKKPYFLPMCLLSQPHICIPCQKSLDVKKKILILTIVIYVFRNYPASLDAERARRDEDGAKLGSWAFASAWIA